MVGLTVGLTDFMQILVTQDHTSTYQGVTEEHINIPDNYMSYVLDYMTSLVEKSPSSEEHAR